MPALGWGGGMMETGDINSGKCSWVKGIIHFKSET